MARFTCSIELNGKLSWYKWGKVYGKWQSMNLIALLFAIKAFMQRGWNSDVEI